MIWKVDEIISKISEQHRLMPGDIILTGTPAGVGAVQSGDVLDWSVDGLEPMQVRIGRFLPAVQHPRAVRGSPRHQPARPVGPRLRRRHHLDQASGQAMETAGAGTRKTGWELAHGRQYTRACTIVYTVVHC